MLRRNHAPLIALAVFFSMSAALAGAAVVRFHYLPALSPQNTTLKPVGGGELFRWFGAVREPYHGPLRATHVVTFRHPYSGRNVSVPMALPEGTPNILHRADRIIFNYGSYTVGAQFLPDGSVDVIYDSGLLREP